ncbi:centromere protein M isoform X1 [Ambystoma mexicanum]|uniref:centromere protein M isoform X1 n=1 Tax=Ambystoma mexicanum TaxID=8296 RepID=UPI0037E95C3C
MTTLRPFHKMPVLNEAVVLLVGSDERLQELLAEAMLKEPKQFELKIHLARSLPLPSEYDHLRPRIDMVVFLVNLQSQLSFSTVKSSLAHLDASFFLGKVCFLAIGGGRVKHSMVDMSTVKTLADTHLSTLLLSELESEAGRAYTAQQLLQMLRVCAGHVPGVSALYLGSIIKRPTIVSQDA